MWLPVRWAACALLVAASAAPAAAQPLFDSWTVDNGLPQDSVNDIVQTRDGYLWLATYGGLVRFDGARFTVFDRSIDDIESQRVRRLLKTWSFPEGLLLARFSGHEQGVTSAVVTRDGTRVVSSSEDRTIIIWKAELAARTAGPPPRGKPPSPYASVRKATIERRLTSHTAAVEVVMLSTDGLRIISGSADRSVRIWNLRDGAIERSIEGHAGPVRVLAV